MGAPGAKSLEAISGAFMALCTLAVVLRFYARKVQKMALRSDDWAMLAAVIFLLAFSSCCLVLVHIKFIGNGEFPNTTDFPHLWDYGFNIVMASNIALYLALSLTKISALLLYKRTFFLDKRYSPVLYWVIVGTILVLIGWTIAMCFAVGFQCGTHLEETWSPVITAKYCSNKPVLILYVLDVAFDLWVIALPFPLILRLRMPTSTKLLTMGVFSIALAGFAASIARLILFIEVVFFNVGAGEITHVEDDDSTQFFYNTLEVGMMIISINAPVLWSLLVKHAPEAIVRMARSISSLTSHNSGNGSGNQSGTQTQVGQVPLATLDAQKERKPDASSQTMGV